MGLARALVVSSVMACSAPPAPAPVLAAPVVEPRPPDPFRLTETSFGPITTETVASLSSLRRTLPGYDVRPRNDDDLQFMVSKGGEDLFYVIVDDATGLVFNIHVVSPKIRAPHRKWRAKQVFRGSSALTDCECWGTAPMCFERGDHMAVGFERGCEGLDTREERRALEGMVIDRIVWSPTVFGFDNDDDDVDADPCAGNPCGP